MKFLVFQIENAVVCDKNVSLGMMLGNIHGVLTAVALYGVCGSLPATLSILQRTIILSLVNVEICCNRDFEGLSF